MKLASLLVKLIFSFNWLKVGATYVCTQSSYIWVIVGFCLEPLK